jgi:uracil-DNA glycosylase
LTKAEIVFVGEQPGDREDREGRPFVGPAGRVLDEALGEAGIDRRLAYVTNAPNVLASREAYAALVADLRVVAELLATCGRPGAGAARRPS